MYLTGGQFKGHKIEYPKNTRPTLSKVRESVFNILFQYFPDGGCFLDMFAGSAIMGLEALSRGYTVDEIEINPKTAAIIKENYKKIKIKPNIIICDALRFVTKKKYDVIYIDPPWDNDYEIILKKAKELLSPGGIITVEHDLKINTDFNIITTKTDLKIIKEKKYGRVLLTFLSL